MKRFLIALLAFLSVVSFGAVHSIHHPLLRASTPCKMLSSVSWKAIVAGGAAAGTIISAYKISNGIEAGIKSVAKEKPKAFADTLSVLIRPVRWAVLASFIFLYYWLRGGFKHTPKPKG